MEIGNTRKTGDSYGQSSCHRIIASKLSGRQTGQPSDLGTETSLRCCTVYAHARLHPVQQSLHSSSWTSDFARSPLSHVTLRCVLCPLHDGPSTMDGVSRPPYAQHLTCYDPMRSCTGTSSPSKRTQMPTLVASVHAPSHGSSQFLLEARKGSSNLVATCSVLYSHV